MGVLGLPVGIPGGVGGGTKGGFATLRLIGIFAVTDPTYGAVGDGAHNAADTAGIIAANTAAAAFATVTTGGGTVYFPDPPVAYGATQELAPAPGTMWIGEARRPGQSTIRAVAAMRSVIMVDTTQVGNSDTPTQANFVGLTVDANNNANYAVLRIGDFECRYERVFVRNAKLDGFHAAVCKTAATLSAVTATVPGGSPAGVTVTLNDPNFIGILSSGIYSVRLKVSGGGTSYLLSLDGGVTFATAAQGIVAAGQSNVCNTSAAKYNAPLGITVHFPAGVYHDNDHYDLTITVHDGDFAGVSSNICADAHFYECIGELCGSTRATIGIAVNYNPVTVIPGTASTTIGSQVIAFTGTSLLSYGAREGDVLTVNNTIFPIACVLDDTHIAVAFGAEPSFTLAGQDFALSIGYGYYEDTGQEIIRNTLQYCVFTHSNANGQRFSGGQGPYVLQNRIAGYTGIGTMMGGWTVMSEFVLEHPHWEAGQGPAAQAYYINRSVNTGSVNNPPELNTFGTSSGFWKVDQGGVVRQGAVQGNAPGISSMLASYSLTMQASSFTFTAANQTIPAPTISNINGDTSYVLVSSNARYVLGGALTIGAPSINGQVICLINIGAFPLMFQPDSLQTTGLLLDAPLVALGNSDCLYLIADAGKWRQLAPVGSQYASFGFGGSSGHGKNYLKTTTNAVSAIYTVIPVNPGVAPFSCLKFDVRAKSADGVNFAAWLNCTVTWDTTGTIVAFTVGTAVGSGGGGVPPTIGGNMWAVTTDFVNPFGHINVAGDNSANAVTWVIDVTHRDGATL